METVAPTYTHSHGYSGIAQGSAPTEKITPLSNIDKPADNAWGEDGFSFGDMLDVINPLQHLPVISTIYRALTNDEIAPGPRLIGGAIFGGPFGFASAMANTAIEEATGKDVGEHVIALIGLGSEGSTTENPSNSSKPIVADVSTDREAPAASEAPSQVAHASTAAAPPITPLNSATAVVVQLQPAPAATTSALPYAIKSSALAQYQNTAWGALLVAHQAETVPATPPLTQPSANPGEQPQVTQGSSVQGEIEHLFAQEFAERLMLSTHAFRSTSEPRNRSDDRAY
tara:strand:+ start:414 stop:1271 length:858 start_codon:yes stop_codon:yes gene_type:complete